MVKSVYDYVDKILEKFPYLSKKEIELILFRGFRMFDLLMRRGIPLHIIHRTDSGKKHKFYIGQLSQDLPILEKLKNKKSLLMSFLRKEKYDGYYYASVSENIHQLLLKQDNKIFNNIVFFRYKSQLKNSLPGSHFWKIKYIPEKGNNLFIKEYTTKEAYCIDGKCS